MRRWKILARHHNWVKGAVITELLDETSPCEKSVIRFVATIRGFRNWRIWRGDTHELTCEERVCLVKERVYAIRGRIDRGDEAVFREPGAW